MWRIQWVWVVWAVLLPANRAVGITPVAVVGDAARSAMSGSPNRNLDHRLAASMRGDAELAAVCFVGPQQGWAVGDRGVIWHTSDGGEQWSQQESGVVCRLDDVTFLDAMNGWAVGGATQPYLQTSHAVVLRTRDGGGRWTRIGGPLLPALTKVIFLDARHGMALGRRCDVFPSGIFLTEDGGRSWSPVLSTTTHGYLAGDLININTGAVAGHAGTLAVLRDGLLQPARSATAVAPRSCRNLVLLPPTRGWLVGDGGLILATGDLGQSWQAPPGRPTASSASHFDFNAVAARGEECWVAGAPGSRVFYTADGGVSWTAYATGSRVPIRDLTMLDGGQGWAVGSLGTILATDDNGRTWTRQRAGGARAALLAICAEPQQLPLELFAQLSAEAGYLGVATLIGRPAAVATDTAWRERAHEAVVAVGGCRAEAAWQFPIRPAALRLPRTELVRDLDLANDGRGLQQLDAAIVRAIRTWRPAVVFTPGGQGEGNPPLESLLQQAVLNAVAAAADPAQYTDMTTDAGLGPWSVVKVFGILPAGDTEGIPIRTTRLATRLGRSLVGQTSQPHGLISGQYHEVPPVVAFRSLVDRTSSSGRRPSFFQGISLAVGGPARRTPPALPFQAIDQLKQMVQKYGNMREVLRQRQDNPAWLAQIGNLTAGLDPRSAGDLLFQLGQQYIASGQSELAAEIFDRLVRDNPHHGLTPVAQAWLLRYYASGEAAWQATLHGVPLTASATPSVFIRRLSSGTSGARGTKKVGRAGSSRRSGGVVTASGTAGPHTELDSRSTRAVEIGTRLKRRQPMLFADPQLRFPLAVAERKLGDPKPAQQLFMTLSRGRPHDAWWACAAAERWLAEPRAEPPKPVWNCRRATPRPHLDGQLDEPFWQDAQSVPLQSRDQDDALWPASAWLAYDDQFLYFAAECHKAPGATYPASAAPRPRDPDLSAHDRIELMFDVDRDYATYYRLTVDHRGWTGEACLGDATWNPAWYVAAHNDGETWTVEAAIPWRALHGQVPEPGLAWAVGVQRVVPGVGFQAWTEPADLDVVPEGFGLLMLK
jgi:photosystem II stability/assembly factor-like uncharacterized protein